MEALHCQIVTPRWFWRSQWLAVHQVVQLFLHSGDWNCEYQNGWICRWTQISCQSAADRSICPCNEFTELPEPSVTWIPIAYKTRGSDFHHFCYQLSGEFKNSFLCFISQSKSFHYRSSHLLLDQKPLLHCLSTWINNQDSWVLNLNRIDRHRWPRIARGW